MSKCKRNTITDNIRKLIIVNYNDGKTMKELANTFALPKGTINGILSAYKKEGRVEGLERGGSRFCKITLEMKEFIRHEVDNKCDVTLKCLKEMIMEKFKVSLSQTTIHSCLKDFHYSFKKIKVCAQRSLAPELIQQRLTYATEFQDLLAIKNERNIFFIDEVGFNVSMRSRHGRALKGKAPVRYVPALRSRNISICCSINKHGDKFYKQQNYAFNSSSFYVYIEDLMSWISENKLTLCTLVMDNVPFHKNTKIKDLIEVNGHELRFLPAYTPQFNPIENMFSKWKHYIRINEPKNEDELNVLISNGLLTITSNDCAGFFRNMLKEMRNIN